MAERKSRSKASQGSKGSKSESEHSARMTADHDEIRRWAEERGGKPACVRGTESGDSCLLRIDFPGGAGEESFDHISWDEFFEVLDEGDLVLLYQEQKADGEPSTFNKFLRRGDAESQSGGGSRGKRKSSGRHGRDAE